MTEQKPLPQGWTWAKIEDFCEVILGQSPPSSDYNSLKQGLPFFQGKTEFGAMKPIARKWCTNPLKIAEELDVLISVRAPVGPTNLAPSKCCIGRGLAALRPQAEISSLYLLYALRANESNIAELGVGTTFEAISGDVLRKFALSLAPIEEQRRVVEKLDALFSELDAGLEAIERIKAKVKSFRASLLRAATSGELSAQWRAENAVVESGSQLLERILDERRAAWEEKESAKRAAKSPTKKLLDDESWKSNYIAPQVPDTSNLPELPESWTWTSVEQLKDFSLYGPRFSSDDYSSTGVFVLRTSDIDDAGKVDYARTPRLELSEDDYQKYRTNQGDILITRTGSIGTVSLFNDNVRAIPGAYLLHYRFFNILLPAFLFLFFKSPEIQKRLRSGAAGIGRPNLNAPTIDQLQFPLPSLAEQEWIVAEVEQRMSLATEAEKTINKAYKRAQSLKASILESAFRGELTDQNPNEESAETLLETIRIARIEAADEVKKNRKPKLPKMPKNTSKSQLPLFDTLIEAGGEMTPEKLFQSANYAPETVDDFYEALRGEVSDGRIEEVREKSTIVLRVIEQDNVLKEAA